MDFGLPTWQQRGTWHFFCESNVNYGFHVGAWNQNQYSKLSGPSRGSLGCDFINSYVLMLFRVFEAANIFLGAVVRIFRYGYLIMSYVAIPVCLHVAIFMP